MMTPIGMPWMLARCRFGSVGVVCWTQSVHSAWDWMRGRYFCRVAHVVLVVLQPLLDQGFGVGDFDIVWLISERGWRQV
jgi:hypothetical protein